MWATRLAAVAGTKRLHPLKDKRPSGRFFCVNGGRPCVYCGMKWLLGFLWLGTIQLHVFRKIGGGLLHSVAVPAGSNGVPPATFKAGLLKPVPTGLENFGTRVLFRGDKPGTAKPRRTIVHGFRRILN